MQLWAVVVWSVEDGVTSWSRSSGGWVNRSGGGGMGGSGGMYGFVGL